ncbi:MAG: NADH-quinone oxidoreductase subunit N [Proteobacteria bacterium]|nr:NADH-quinone oxidoreductase subunit N [Pseudomonadota bacterium]MBU1716193.1 NADH-quinone oxidoreductase subunit N [Pseudomonadota bacterium]
MKLMLFAPELLVLIGCLIIFMVSLGKGNGRTARNLAATIAVLNVIVTLLCFFQDGALFYKVYQIDLFSQLFKLLIAFGLAAVILFSKELKGISEDVRPEYYLFLLLSALGLMMVVSSVELLTLFIALELSSFSLYLLVPMREDSGGLRTQMECAAKYILFGVVVTGIMLFGMSYLFGLTGTTYLGALLPKLHLIASQPVAVVGILMVMAGFAFKLGLFPFHFWVPDVYQGASNETTAFVASVPKVAAIALMIRIASLMVPEGSSVPVFIGVMAIASMFYGNLLALVQTDVKRMLGFSGIAHAGYVMLGILVFRETGYSNAIFYITGYLVMNLACFLVICNVSTAGENVTINDLSGLHKRAPVLAVTLLVGMFALAGIPPFVGFMGKFMLLSGALSQGYLVFVILAAINTAISIYYYLSVVRVAFTASAEKRNSIEVGLITKTVSVALMVIIIVMGVVPSTVLEMAAQAVKTIMITS